VREEEAKRMLQCTGRYWQGCVPHLETSAPQSTAQRFRGAECSSTPESPGWCSWGPAGGRGGGRGRHAHPFTPAGTLADPGLGSPCSPAAVVAPHPAKSTAAVHGLALQPLDCNPGPRAPVCRPLHHPVRGAGATAASEAATNLRHDGSLPAHQNATTYPKVPAPIVSTSST
jgi:hypothetical protein